MFDLVYTDSSHKDIGVVKAYNLDAAWGADENDFELLLPATDSIEFGALVYIDGTQLGGVVDDKSPDATSDIQTVTYHGRTWHGIMADSVLSPDAGKDYLTYSGDANGVIRTIISRQGLGDIFTCDGDAGISVSGRFDRYTDMYSGLMKMLSRDASRRGRLRIYKEPGGKVHVEAVPVSEYTSEVDSDRYGFKSTVDARPYNHLICLGEGDLKDRDVVHLYADANGNVSTTQTLFGIDERTITYDYSNAEHDELVSKGTERLLELQRTSGVSMSVASDTGTFEVGDVVGAYDNLTGIYAESYVNKVIVNVGETGFATYSYEVGEIGTVGKSSAGGGVSMSTLQAGYVKKSGDTMSGDLHIEKSKPYVVLKANDVDYADSSLPAYRDWVFGARDKNDKYCGFLQTQKNADGSVYTRIAARNGASGSAVTNDMYLRVATDGSRSVQLADHAAWHSALNTKGQGAVIRLYGSGSAAADALSLTTSYQNLFAGKCAANIANGNDGVSGIFTADVAKGEVTVNAAGNYLVYAKAYFYTGFTVGNWVQIAIAKNGTSQAESMSQARANAANMYTFVSTLYVQKFNAGEKISVVVKNNQEASGTCQRYNTSNLTVVKL